MSWIDGTKARSATGKGSSGLRAGACAYEKYLEMGAPGQHLSVVLRGVAQSQVGKSSGNWELRYVWREKKRPWEIS